MGMFSDWVNRLTGKPTSSEIIERVKAASPDPHSNSGFKYRPVQIDREDNSIPIFDPAASVREANADARNRERNDRKPQRVVEQDVGIDYNLDVIPTSPPKGFAAMAANLFGLDKTSRIVKCVEEASKGMRAGRGDGSDRNNDFVPVRGGGEALFDPKTAGDIETARREALTRRSGKGPRRL